MYCEHKSSTTPVDGHTGNKNKKIYCKTKNKAKYLNEITLEEELSEAPSEQNTGLKKKELNI